VTMMFRGNLALRTGFARNLLGPSPYARELWIHVGRCWRIRLSMAICQTEFLKSFVLTPIRVGAGPPSTARNRWLLPNCRPPGTGLNDPKPVSG